MTSIRKAITAFISTTIMVMLAQAGVTEDTSVGTVVNQLAMAIASGIPASYLVWLFPNDSE